MPEELAGAAEVAEMLGISRQAVHKLSKGADFPEPVARLKAGAIWERDVIATWAGERGRVVHAAAPEA